MEVLIRRGASPSISIQSNGATTPIDTDGTLALNSDGRIATQKAVKTYVDGKVTGLLEYKGATNCSGNPNYPAASKGDWYKVSVGGKIGGASGTIVEAGDVFIANADNAGGTEASVGSSWDHVEHNIAISDDAYDATSWNGNLDAPSKNAVRDKLEVMAALVYTDAMARAAIGYPVTVFATTAPSASEVLCLHVVTDAFDFPANFANSKYAVGTNPAATFVIDVQRQVNATGAFTTIGTISISTGGAFTLTTVSGTAKSIAVNDVLKFVAPASTDASILNLVATLRGSRT